MESLAGSVVGSSVGSLVGSLGVGSVLSTTTEPSPPG